MGSLTRGPLPSSVYWRRRLVLVTGALVLVVLIAKLLGGGSDGSSGDSAAPVDSSTSASTSAEPSGSASPSAPARHRRAHPGRATLTPPPASPTSSAPPAPTGPCAPSDIVATPSVTGAYAGSPVTVVLQLRTRTTPACTWHVTKDAVQVRIGRGGMKVWSTIGCPHAVPTADVVVRRDTTSTLAISWDGHRSDQRCSTHSPWAPAGPYSIVASALGGEPVTATFTLARPTYTPAPPTSSAPATASPSTSTAPASSATSGASSPTSGSTAPSSATPPKR